MRLVQAAKIAITMLAMVAGGVQAAWPDKPIRLVVGFPPGGGADYVARQVATALTAELGQNVVVDNKPGANGITAAAEVARATSDGYTLLLGVTATQSISPALYPKLPYEPLKDFTPITEVGFTPLVLVVGPQVPVASVADFIRLAQQTDQVTFASAGNGNITHMAAELFILSTGTTKMTHVPYKGSSPAIMDLMGGRITAYFDTLPSSLPFIQGGQLKALAVTSAARSSAVPNLPTLQEAGVADYEATAWFGLLGPAKLPAALAARLHEALAKAMGGTEMRQQMAGRGVQLVLDPPAAFQKMLETDLARWRRVTEKARIKLE